MSAAQPGEAFLRGAGASPRARDRAGCDGASVRGVFLGDRVTTTIPSASLFQLDFQVELSL